MASVQIVVVMDRHAVEELRGWNGPIGHRLELCAKEIVWRAKLIAPKRTGAMAAGIHWTPGRNRMGLTATIGTPARYAAIMELGSRPHEILPKRTGGLLVFFWPKVGHVVHLPRVWHPGTRAYLFLTKALERGVRSMF